MSGQISRKAFLRGAVGAVAAGARFGSSRADAVSVAQDWSELAASIDGDVLLRRTGAAYQAVNRVFNSRYDSTPTAVVRVKSQNDVRRAVGLAAANEIGIVARSGGHSYTGASAATGAMVLDLRQLPGEVDYDDVTGRVPVTPDGRHRGPGAGRRPSCRFAPIDL
jgi:FAD/FMN-containing dehydrogenase